MTGQGFVHSIDPVICRFGGVPLYYYGLAYSIGFLGIHLWLRFRRNTLRWRLSDVYDFSILTALCVLLFGRLFSVLVYQWGYYADHPGQILGYWRGGMATHGVLLGGIISMLVFSRMRGESFLRLTDEIAVPAAFLLALGRIGNFINGQIVGTPTDLPWGVKFPGVKGFRHPITLYEALKNLALIPILLLARRRWPARDGMVTAHFIFWYGFLRIFTDLFRDHPGEIFGIGGSQYFNGAMAVAGLAMMTVLWTKCRKEKAGEPVKATREGPPRTADSVRPPTAGEGRAAFWLRRIGFALILLFSLTIRSAWTPDELERRRNTPDLMSFLSFSSLRRVPLGLPGRPVIVQGKVVKSEKDDGTVQVTAVSRECGATFQGCRRQTGGLDRFYRSDFRGPIPFRNSSTFVYPSPSASSGPSEGSRGS